MHTHSIYSRMRLRTVLRVDPHSFTCKCIEYSVWMHRVLLADAHSVACGSTHTVIRPKPVERREQADTDDQHKSRHICSETSDAIVRNSLPEDRKQRGERQRKEDQRHSEARRRHGGEAETRKRLFGSFFVFVSHEILDYPMILMHLACA